MQIRSSSVGGALREARLRSGVTQEQLAGMLRISPWTLNRVEHGKRGFDTAWMALMPLPLSTAVKEALAQEVERTFAQSDIVRRVLQINRLRLEGRGSSAQRYQFTRKAQRYQFTRKA